MLDTVDKMVTELHEEKLMDEEAEKRKEEEEIAKLQGKTVEKKYVCIEYYDSTENEPVFRSCGGNVRLVNVTVKHVGRESFAAIFVSFGTLHCNQVKVYSEGGDGVYVTQGSTLKCKQGCHFGPCKRNGIMAEGLCTNVEISDCELRGNVHCGLKVAGGASISMKKNRINSNDLHGVNIGAGCQADLMQNR